MRSFAEIPGLVHQRVRAGERVLVVLLDAFGLEFLERHFDHPLVRQLKLTEMRSQFPSTTTAHVSTIYYGTPVEQHGLYEWNILEPSVEAIVCPLRHTFAESSQEGDLSRWVAAEQLAPATTFYESLDGGAEVFLPAAIVDSEYSRAATRGARRSGFIDLTAAARDAVRSLTRGSAVHAFIYWDQIDAVGHLRGPSSAEFAQTARHALDHLWRVLARVPDDVTVLLTADHGQIDVSPDRVDYLDDLWPDLHEHLQYARPAGSSRDVFLHVEPGSEGQVSDALAARLDGRAEVRVATELFSDIDRRLSERLGTIAILPEPGRQAWLRSATASEAWFRGQHGGLTSPETSTYIAELES